MNETAEQPRIPSTEQFTATMQAVQAERPSSGKAIGKAMETILIDDTDRMPDPATMTSSEEAEIGHNLASFAAEDLAPFGLRLDITSEAGGDGSTRTNSKLTLSDGKKFAGFLGTIEPQQVDNGALMDPGDPCWELRRAISKTFGETYRHTYKQLMKGEEFDEPSRQFIEHGPAIGKALDDMQWANDSNEARMVTITAGLQQHAEAGIGKEFVRITSAGFLQQDTTEAFGGDADGEVDDQLINNFSRYLDDAQFAAVTNPDLAETWPDAVRSQYDATVKHLGDSGKIAELILLEGELGEKMHPGPPNQPTPEA